MCPARRSGRASFLATLHILTPRRLARTAAPTFPLPVWSRACCRFSGTGRRPMVPSCPSKDTGLPTGTAVYSANPKRSVQENFGLGRFDYYVSTQDSVSANFSADRGARRNPVDPTFLSDQQTDLHTFSTQETHIFSPTLLNIASFGYSSTRATTKAPPVEPFPDNLLFLKGGGRNNPGSVIIGGGTSTVQASALIAPNGQNLAYNARRNFSFSDDLKLTKGIHNLSLGAWFQRVEQTAFSSGQNNAGAITYPTLLAFLQDRPMQFRTQTRSEEHTSELQSPCNLVCRLLLEKKKKTHRSHSE